MIPIQLVLLRELIPSSVNYYHFFEVTNSSIRSREINIENLEEDVNANFFQVFDFNNDGYDDLIENTYKNGQPNVYLNTQSGGFSKVNVDVLFPLTEYVTKNWKFQMKFLNFKDDGLFDLVVFLHRERNLNLSLVSTTTMLLLIP